MKSCPFCAEEIQDAAIVCKHCNRDLVEQPRSTAPKKASRIGSAIMVLGFVALGFVAVVLFVARAQSSPDLPPDEEFPLNVTAARGVGGFAMTNRHNENITDCTVTILDNDANWTAVILALKPLATAEVPWRAFVFNRQSMPGYVGLNRQDFRVVCSVDGRASLHYATLHF